VNPLKALLDYIDSLVKREPARVAALIASVVVFVCVKLGVNVPESSVYDAVIAVLPILFAGEVTRAHVTPVANKDSTPVS
jgi:hypothetical protein